MGVHNLIHVIPKPSDSSIIQYICIMILALFPIVLMGGLLAAAADSPVRQSDKWSGAATKHQWQEIKSGLKNNRQSMCSFLLDQADEQREPLTLAKVTSLFERSLDHLGKATGYVSKMRPYVEAQVVTDFDNNGRKVVLEVSNARVKLIDEYQDATNRGESDQVKAQILEKYFYKACTNKLGTILAEKSMYDAAKRVEQMISQQLLHETSPSSSSL